MKLVMEQSPAIKVLFNMKSQLKMLMARGICGKSRVKRGGIGGGKEGK